LVIAVEERKVNKVIKVILERARTGEIGDGMIFVSPIEETIRVRTREKGKGAKAITLHFLNHSFTAKPSLYP